MMLTVVRARPVLAPPRPEKDDELERFCRSMQLVTRRDMDGTATTVLRAILEETPDQPVGSSELAARTRINRVTIIHHLNRLEEVGLVEHTEHKYRLSVAGFGEMVRKIRADTEKMLDEAEELAREIDKEYALNPGPRGRALSVEARFGRPLAPRLSRSKKSK
ncbi:MAG: winged helix-turn-helix transcriptional regulator [Candidatus Micrarchaeota archaeon]|nr:winged helix-turn-helix transcriptional regulator [Candidatus Micrarchaeota archaeon]